MVLRRRHFSLAVILAAACGGTPSNEDLTGGAPSAAAGASGGGADAGAVCRACVTDADCGGGVCAQLGGDTYCAARCPGGDECASDQACTTLSTASGEQVNACVPRGDVCGADVGPEVGSKRDAGTNGTCGALAGPNVKAACSSCGGSHACQANGCYGGWWCNTTTDKCQAPPANCGGGSNDAGAGGGGGSNDAGAGGGGPDAGPPVTGSVGANGGTVSRLFFGVVGDTRPAVIDDTSAYPTAVIDGIYSAIQALSPSPPFVVSTGDYQFSSANGPQSSPQMDMYLSARAKYAGAWFPAMGNHECTGATASNCGSGNANGVTVNYSNFLSKLLGPIQKKDPYYSIRVDAADGSWTSKFVFVAANAWSDAQATWLASTLAQPTTYTFVVRHEPAAASTAPGVRPSEQIMAQHPYTLAITGHTHTYAKSGRQIIIGNGGAPLTGHATYGYALVSQRADGAVQIDVVDAATGQPDLAFRFAVKPDGSPAP